MFILAKKKKKKWRLLDQCKTAQSTMTDDMKSGDEVADLFFKSEFYLCSLIFQRLQQQLQVGT